MSASADVGTADCRSHARDLPPAWDALCDSDALFLTRDWLAVIEQVTSAPFRYYLAWRGGRLAGALPAVVFDDETGLWSLGRPDGLLRARGRLGEPAALAAIERLGGDAGLTGRLLPGAVCGGRHMGLSRLLIGGNVEHPAAVADTLLDHVEQDATRDGLRSLSFLYVSATDRLLASALTRHGYRAFPSGRYAWLDVPAGGFPRYTQNLPADRQRKVRRERQRGADAGVTTRPYPLSDDLIPCSPTSRCG